MPHAATRILKYCGTLASFAAIAVCILYIAKSAAQSGKESQPQAQAVADSSNASPIYGVTIPPGYRDWKLIAVKHLNIGDIKVDQLRAKLGNDIAIKAFEKGTIPFPDGSIIAALHWTRALSSDDSKVIADVFPGAQSYVVGSAVNVQFMVKDSKKYAATGGWGFADFTNGKPGDKKLHEACFPCHGPAKAHDFVFTHYAPTP
jgi:hypothetical protein